MRQTHLGKTGFWKNKSRLNLINENNPAWKGDEASYEAIHAWIRKKLGKATKCSNDINHKSKRFVWANISGEYKREISDWHELCHSCNRKDGIKISIKLKSRLLKQNHNKRR